MILTCPECETQYFADDNTIGGDGRSVKCAACGHAWFVRADGSQGSQSQEETRSGHQRYLQLVSKRRKKQSRLAATLVWSVMATLAVAAIIGAYVYRDGVVSIWPKSASLYRVLGLEVNRFGLDFENIERSRELVGTMPVLSVAADVRNITTTVRQAPAVRVGLLDEYGKEIAFMLAEVVPADIPAGEVGRFRAVLENPPVESYQLDLRFVPRDEAGPVSPPAAPAEGDNLP